MQQGLPDASVHGTTGLQERTHIEFEKPCPVLRVQLRQQLSGYHSEHDGMVPPELGAETQGSGGVKGTTMGSLSDPDVS